MTLARCTQLSLAAALLAVGCGTPATSHDAGSGATAAIGGSGGMGGSIDTCGQCVPGQPLSWSEPVLVWFGDEKNAPECPLNAARIVYEGHADLTAPHDCGACTCGVPSGSCELPKTMTANAATCALDNGATPHTLFNPATGWDGACDTNASIPSGKLCSGVPCVKSLSIGPLAIAESPCTASQAPPQIEPPVWKSFTRACSAAVQVPCSGASGVCLGVPPAGAGFRVCIFQYGDRSCSDPWLPPYTEKHVFYGKYEDTRACAPCTCGAPSGGSCSSSVSIFTDGACSTPAYTAMVTSAGPDCHDVPSGSPLGSKSATAPTYTPGACTPEGGEPMGAVTPVDASTYCCLPLQ